MILCLDTSAVNCLLQDPEREAIVTGLLATASFRITCYNVLEAAGTRDGQKRVALVRLLCRLARNTRPLDPPNHIIRAAARAFASGTPTVTVNAAPSQEGVWRVLNAPELLDDDDRKETLAWADGWIKDFDAVVSGDREAFQTLFRETEQAPPPTAAATLKALSKHRELLRDRLVGRIYERETGETLTPERFEQLVEEPLWWIYLAVYGYAFHQRSIRRDRFARTRHAGAIDLGQAVYLPMCDRFVTNDIPQYRALRLLNRLNTKRKTEVLRYSTFRARLLVL